ncbi:MAG: hypothetical protein RRB22_05905 [Gammaproteobacteria bacterium]|nr:hypothetical protein [Gammaproteobacteria bacterium]
MKTILAIITVLFVTVGAAIAGSPILVDPSTGKYLGNLNNNPYDPNSVSNPYGQYGSKYSPDSINNPYGEYGSPYSDKSPNNPYGTGPAIIDTDNY